MLSRFFIDRPIFAAVIAILIVLAGAVSIPVLPVEQYPDIAPPTVQVTAHYPGANAQTVADTVTTPIEQEVNGVEDMLYMSSNSSDDGSTSLTVTFALGTDLDMAAVRVQNRVALAEPRLPEEVRRQGITVEKRSTSLLMVVSMLSPDGTYDSLYLSNYATLRIKDALSRVPGVGAVQAFGGSNFSMRIWMNPDALAARNLTTVEVLDALREQNVQVAAGSVGQEPTEETEGFQLTVKAQGRLRTAEQFSDIVLKVGRDRAAVRLADVARVELGAQSYDAFARRDLIPAGTLGIYQRPGSNAVEVAQAVRDELESLSKSFPEGLVYQISYDFTRFVAASIREVSFTLLLATFLVFLTVYAFLQDWRTTIIPGVAIPVSIIGTFGALLLFGFSINLLTLFGLVLAIGIVVDDAIVVTENAKRNVDELGLGARDATRRALDEITGPVIATTLVVLAVFVPTIVLQGVTGQLYRQFGLTVSIATVISGVNALTLSPALCALLMRKAPENPGGLKRWFNLALERGRAFYLRRLEAALRSTWRATGVFLALAAVTGWAFATLPRGFLPQEDQSYFFVNVQLPDGAKLTRTDELLSKAEHIMWPMKGIKGLVGLGGRSILSGALQSNAASIITILDDWDERRGPDMTADAIMARVSERLQVLQGADILAFQPTSIRGLGQSGGLDLRIQDRSGVGLGLLQDFTADVVGAAAEDPVIVAPYSPFSARVPQLYVDIDRVKAKRLGVDLADVFSTLQANLGSIYVNDFNRFGRTYQVRVQAEPDFRADASDIGRLQVRNRDGGMLPLATVADVRSAVGPSIIARYNLYPAASVSARPAPGYSTGQARERFDQILAQVLPDTMGYEWSGMTYQEIAAGSMAATVFVFAVIVAFLLLAAQYESWSAPLAILLTVPVGVLGALGATWLAGLDNNVYTQIGLVLLIALVCKNAILIVEFARQACESGKTVAEATLEAARLRFRPILMTSFTFILGVAPMVIATGAGAASRRALGTAVFGGMLAASTVGLFFIPVLFALVQRSTNRLSAWRKRHGHGRTNEGVQP